MKTPRELAEEVVEGHRTDERPGHAPGIDLTDRIEIAIADALRETREACARICDAEAAKWRERADETHPINSLIPAIRSEEAESCAAAIRAGGQS